MTEPDDSPLTALCKKLEHFETPEWAAREILNHEIMTPTICDPCAGTGVLGDAAELHGYTDTREFDIHRWEMPSGRQARAMDFINPPAELLFHLEAAVGDNTVFMNPPFKYAKEFVRQAFRLGARKVVCFQRFSWFESDGRNAFWDEFPPNRIYVCGSRATCWRHDVPANERVDLKGNPKSTPTAHAWFIWERGHPRGTLTGRIYNHNKKARA